MSNRKHDRDHFFKYSSYETALQVIASKSFRWSSPLNFNDPFDHQVGLILDIDEAEFAELLTASIDRIVFAAEDPKIEPESLFSSITLKLRAIRGKLPRKEFLREMHEGSKESAAKLQPCLEELNTEIHAQLCNSRVFCVSERRDNVVMWSHYADEHKGAVFKLRCIDEIDNALLAAREITYSDSFITFLSAEQYVNHLTREVPVDIEKLCWDMAFTKHSDWEYEKEWRVHASMLDAPPGDGHAIYLENDRVFEEIYLGCRMADNEVSALVRASREALPDMKIFKATKSTKSFALNFTEI